MDYTETQEHNQERKKSKTKKRKNRKKVKDYLKLFERIDIYQILEEIENDSS